MTWLTLASICWHQGLNIEIVNSECFVIVQWMYLLQECIKNKCILNWFPTSEICCLCELGVCLQFTWKNGEPMSCYLIENWSFFTLWMEAGSFCLRSEVYWKLNGCFALESPSVLFIFETMLEYFCLGLQWSLTYLSIIPYGWGPRHISVNWTNCNFGFARGPTG